MRILVTGAGGFLGRHVVAAAVSGGHVARALVRPGPKSAPEWWRNSASVETVAGDLRDRRCIDELLRGVDVVAHLAAAKSGDVFDQLGSTVGATENLLAAMERVEVRRLVLTSSFAVYEYMRRWTLGRLDESSPLAVVPGERDAYCQTKLLQESLVLEKAADPGWSVVVLRPGVIFGRDNTWSARLGIDMGRTWIQTGLFARLPLTYVENCADAVVRACEYRGAERRLVLNVVDDRPPTKFAYARRLRAHLDPRPASVPVPWRALSAVARLASLANVVLFGGTAKVPGVLQPASVHARCKALRFSNERIRAVLGWVPAVDWREGLRRSCGSAPTDLPRAVGVPERGRA